MMRRFTVSLHRVGPNFRRQSVRAETLTDHLDWFFQAPGSNHAALLTFATGIDVGQSPTVSAERLASHRAAYLDFSGEISEGRGSIRPLLSGYFDLQVDAPDRFEFLVQAAALLPRSKMKAELPDAHQIMPILASRVLGNSPIRFDLLSRKDFARK